jgi:hypothetical protein
MLQCCHFVLCYEFLNRNRSVCWSIIVKQTQLLVPFFWAFPSDSNPKATKEVIAHFIYSLTPRDELVMENALVFKRFCKLYRRIPRIFRSYYVFTNAWNLFYPANMLFQFPSPRLTHDPTVAHKSHAVGVSKRQRVLV